VRVSPEKGVKLHDLLCFCVLFFRERDRKDRKGDYALLSMLAKKSFTSAICGLCK